MRARPVLVCIAGGSASGKSMIARGLVERLSDCSCVMINVDDYFRDWTVDDGIRTANRPDGVLWPALIDDVDRLLRGEVAELPALGTRAAARGMEPRRLEARDLVVVEGLMALWSDELVERADVKIYVDAPDDERLIRRISRDIVERGATVETAFAWYRHDVLPHFGVFTEPTRWRADIVIPNPAGRGLSATSLAILAAGVRELMQARVTST